MSTRSRPGTTTVPSPATSAATDGAQRELHVGGGELEVAVLGVETHAAEHEDGRAGRERTGNDGHAVGEGVAGNRCFQHIHDHGF